MLQIYLLALPLKRRLTAMSIRQKIIAVSLGIPHLQSYNDHDECGNKARF
jgi:hypothetical protein